MHKVLRTKNPSFTQIKNMTENLKEKYNMTFFLGYEYRRYVPTNSAVEKYNISGVNEHTCVHFYIDLTWEKFQDKYFQLMEATSDGTQTPTSDPAAEVNPKNSGSNPPAA